MVTPSLFLSRPSSTFTLRLKFFVSGIYIDLVYVYLANSIGEQKDQDAHRTHQSHTSCIGHS